MGGVAVGTLAIIIIMSVINGIEGVVLNSFSQLDPHLKISTDTGKPFSSSDSTVQEALLHKGIANYCECLEHEGMMTFAERQSPVIIKGVDSTFQEMYDTQELLHDGDGDFSSHPFPTAIIGIGLANTLNLGVQYNQPSSIYTSKRNSKINLARPETAFTQQDIFVCGIFNMGQAKYNANLAIVPISTARKLFSHTPSTVTYIEIKAQDPKNINTLKRDMEDTLGEKYKVLDRQEQQADFYKILKIEKWVTFLILSFILLIATFNVIGSLSMIMIEKKDDIALFRSLGAEKQLITQLFTFTGWMITSIGAIAGLTLGIATCLVQEHIGIIKMGTGYMVENYPVDIQLTDCLIVLFTVLIMGFFTSIYPVKAALKQL